MSAGPSRVLVAYATGGSEGPTERIAARLAEILRRSRLARPPAGRRPAYETLMGLSRSSISAA